MACLACEKGIPKRGRRRCPLCRRSFRSGWEGVEAHWRAKHAAVLAYERFWSSLCRDHRAPRPADCPSCRKGIPRSLSTLRAGVKSWMYGASAITAASDGISPDVAARTLALAPSEKP